MLIEQTNTLDADIPPIHLAYLKVSPTDKRHFNIEQCFLSEPGIEWYSTPETYRIFRERGISPAGIEDLRSTKQLSGLRDFDFLLVAVPRGQTVILRSFRFKENRFVESFAPKNKFSCEQLYRWLHLVKVISFPDNAYIFVDQKMAGRTPRWIYPTVGEHKLRLEVFEGLVGERTLTIPGDVEVVVKADKAVEKKLNKFGELDEENKFSIGLTAIVAAAIGIAAAILPFILLF